MAAFEDHCRDCDRFLGNRCEPVHRWLDELFSKFGGLHRPWRHHRRGVDEAEKLFGPLGRKAALIHILRDCGHVPKPRDYVEEKVDGLGLRLNGRFSGYWDPFMFVEAIHALIGQEPRSSK